MLTVIAYGVWSLSEQPCVAAGNLVIPKSDIIRKYRTWAIPPQIVVASPSTLYTPPPSSILYGK